MSFSIYPSAEQDSGLHIPISNNTGSLPDLTNLHFPPPLTTPLDSDEQVYQQQGSPANLSPTAAAGGHHGVMMPSPQRAQSSSPASRRRHPHGAPSPLVLHGSPTQMRHAIAPGVRYTYIQSACLSFFNGKSRIRSEKRSSMIIVIVI